LNPLKEDISKLLESLGGRTIAELTTSTSNIALPTLVSARVALQIATRKDARSVCRIDPVGPGEGMRHDFQLVAVPASSYEQTLTEGTDITARDATLSDLYATLIVKGVYTQISDVVARQSAWNTINVMGAAHGNALNRAMNALIYTQCKANTTNLVTEGTTNGGTGSTNYTFADIMTGIGKIEQARGRADAMITFPVAAAAGTSGAATGFYPFIQTNITSVQFTSALASYVSTGRISELFGLELLIDAGYKPSDLTVNGAEMATILQKDEAVGWCQAGEVVSEMQRWARVVGFDMVTSVTGQSAIIVEPFTCSLEHA